MPSWGLRIVPKEGELLSGYLCRAAASHGLSPYEFCSFHFEDTAFWARDVDGLGMRRNHEKIAQKADVTLEEINEMTLARWQTVLVPPRYGVGDIASVTPWINAVGVFHRKRRQHALQFCPLCLTENDLIKREWRLSFVVACDRHKILLRDACPWCGASFVPHRSLGRGYNCHACHLPLTKGLPAISSSHRVPYDLDQLIAVQSEMCAELSRVVRSAHPVSERLLGLRDLISVIGSVRFAGRYSGIPGMESMGRSGSFRVEFSRLEQRVMVLRLVNSAMDDWPVGFRSLSARLGLTGLSFGPFAPLAQWLAIEVDALPPGTPRPKRQDGGRFGQKVADITERRSENWRAVRADVMIRAAGGSR
jgi:hypothetical protein